MLGQWPDLEKVTCSLSQDSVIRMQFVYLFNKHNVILETEA